VEADERDPAAEAPRGAEPPPAVRETGHAAARPVHGPIVEPAGHEIGRRLREIRSWRDLSLQVVADLSGLSYGYLGKIERGEKPVTRTSTLEALARALRVSPAELSGRPYLPTDPVSAAGRAALNEVRVALDELELGLDPEVMPRPWPLLVAEVRRLNVDLRADYAGQGAILPGLLVELHATYLHDPDHRRDALVALMYAYYAATCTTKNLGGVDGWPPGTPAPLPRSWATRSGSPTPRTCARTAPGSKPTPPVCEGRGGTPKRSPRPTGRDLLVRPRPGAGLRAEHPRAERSSPGARREDRAPAHPQQATGPRDRLGVAAQGGAHQQRRPGAARPRLPHRASPGRVTTG